MPPSVVHLPNGHNLTVTPVFGGLYFKANDLSNHHTAWAAFPPGWTIVINSEDEEWLDEPHDAEYHSRSGTIHSQKHRIIHRYKRPTLRNDHIFISSISNPSNNDFRPATSPTRQIAMMLWASLYWYFHQPEPEPQLTTDASKNTAELGRPKGDWRVHINKEGIFKSKLILPKLERMGLISSEGSSVGADIDERAGDGWLEMFVSRQSFWQLDARIFLFSLAPAANSPHPGGSTPYSSRPSSPSGMTDRSADASSDAANKSLGGLASIPGQNGPFRSNSHLPTYYPPHPPQYTFSGGIRHPIRPKPPQQGETFYTRFVPSIGQYLSFRVASQSPMPCPHKGPSSSSSLAIRQSLSDSILPTIGSMNLANSDTELLHKWMNDSRVAHFWGEAGDMKHQEEFLRTALKSKHSFPVIGCWDGRPFGYFEIYWVKEDNLGKLIDGDCGMFDRGVHCLVGEQEFRGAHRVRAWLSALVHFCWLSDLRTEKVLMEPRVDNEKYVLLLPLPFSLGTCFDGPHKIYMLTEAQTKKVLRGSRLLQAKRGDLPAQTVKPNEDLEGLMASASHIMSSLNGQSNIIDVSPTRVSKNS
jgi:RimJ/RimL family protein N-acetyltransferase